MDESLRSQIDSNLSHLDGLIRRGRQLRETLAGDSSNKSALVANRAWQQDCGVAINQLSGGSKAHWLARAFSEAFLLRTTSGQVIEAVAPAEIVERLINVLDQAVVSLSGMGDEHGASGSPPAAPRPRRFDFVHNAELRPVVEQAYADSRDAFEHGSYGVALINSCGILEAIVTDALEHEGIDALVAEAQRLATSALQRHLRLIRGEPIFVPPPVESMDGLWSEAEKLLVESRLAVATSVVTTRIVIDHLGRIRRSDEVSAEGA